MASSETASASRGWASEGAAVEPARVDTPRRCAARGDVAPRGEPGAGSECRASTSRNEGFRDATHASASAKDENDLCSAPRKRVTCALASSHVRYTPGTRPRATP